MKCKYVYKNLRIALIENDLSVMDLAKKAGIEYVTLNRKLRGDGIISLKEALKILTALDKPDADIRILFERFGEKDA